MVLYVDGIDTDEEIIKCRKQIEYWSRRLEEFENRKREEKLLSNYLKTLNN